MIKVKEGKRMKKLIFLVPLLLLVGCSSGNTSETKSAKAESYAAKSESRKAERESRRAEEESRMNALKESKQAKADSEKELHDKFDNVILDNNIVKITLTTKMSAHNAMKCTVENKTNEKINVLAFPTLIRTNKTMEEIYNEHSSIFPSVIEPKSKVNATFNITFHNKEKLGINGYDDYFDEEGRVEFRTTIKVLKAFEGDATTEKGSKELKDILDNPLCEEIAQFDVYKAE